MTRSVILGGVRAWKWTLPALVAIVSFVALFMQVGADWDWQVALGDRIRLTGQIPEGVPFIAADTSAWRNVPVLSEILVSLLHALGGGSVGVVHIALVSMAFLVLALASRLAGASDHAFAGGLLLVCAGSLPALSVIRVQTWSLLLFALLLLLVTTQARRPNGHIWWAPPLVALWGNLHGAVLLGVCVLGAYLVCDRLRRRPAETVAVGVSSLLALCVTPQLWWTPHYYLGVLGNVSAVRGEGLWARASLSNALDLALLGAAVILLAMFLRRRRAWWEYVAVLGLMAATASAARHGVWLLYILVVLVPAPMANAWADDRERTDSGRGTRELYAGAVVTALAVLLIVLPIALARGDVHRDEDQVVAAVVSVAGDGVVLAPAPLVEALAVSGVTIWAGNPLDALPVSAQGAYLDFLDGRPGMAPAVAGSDVIVVRAGSRTAQELGDSGEFSTMPCGPGWSCLVRRQLRQTDAYQPARVTH